jgi:uncharacterized secreted protein with C-terminal beta-propeller domain
MKRPIPLIASIVLWLAVLGIALDVPAQTRTTRAPRRATGRRIADRPVKTVELKALDGCEDLRSYVADVTVETLVRHKYWLVIRPWMGPERNGGATDTPTDFTTTNVQEQGVDELDLVKTDGQYLYVVDNNIFSVVQSWPPERSQLASSLELEGYTHGLFLQDNLTVVFSSIYDDSFFMPERSLRPEYWSGTRIELVDVSDRTAPETIRTIDVEGNLMDARLIDGHVYAVISSYLHIPDAAWKLLERDDLGLPEVEWDASEEERRAAAEEARKILQPHVAEIVAGMEIEELVPLHVDSASARPEAAPAPLIACADLYRPAEVSEYSVLSVVDLDLSGPNPAATEVDAIGLLANGFTVYASKRNLYVAHSGVWWWWGWGDIDSTTAIHKFELAPGTDDPVRYAASGSVDGWLLNQFSMGEHDNHLRVATTEFDWWWGTTDEEEHGSLISVLADDGSGNMKTVGRLSDIAPGEQIYACRFMGDKGYLVTFVQVDPLFTLDLSDPSNPAIVGELKVPGFSSYLHPVGDDYLLSVGLDADEDGAIRGLAVSLFDVSDFSNPTLAQRYLIEDEQGVWSWSEALHDHHAFTYHRNVLSIPAYVSDGKSTFSGLVVLYVNPEWRIGELGRIDHSDLPSGPWGTWTWMRRSVYIEDNLYSISNVGIKVNELYDPEELIAEVPFFEESEEDDGTPSP